MCLYLIQVKVNSAKMSINAKKIHASKDLYIMFI